jgi:putative glycosyltransferase (TIGR04372 family)
LIAFQLSHRNSNVETFQEVVKVLISENYNVIRIGRHVREKAKFQSEFYWDYATSNIQNDLLDVYLFSIAKLCVSTRYGVDDLATLFGVPLFLFDHAEDLFCPDAFYVHPKLFFRGENYILTMDEIESLNISNFRSIIDFQKVGVYFKSNTSKALQNSMLEGLSLLRSGNLNTPHISTEWKKLVNEG